MRHKKFSCPNGCKLPPRRKVLREFDDGTYGFDYHDFSFCPVCGSMMPYSLDKIKGFFDVFDLHPSLEKAKVLLYKSEFEAAARESFVTVETCLKEKSGLDLHGSNLVTNALSCAVDRNTHEITKAPLIAINSLSSESDINEQLGIMHMLMEFFMGPRNLYQHNHIGSGVSNSISVLVEASFFLHLLDGKSITKNGRWIPEHIDYREIYTKMPKRFDRWKLLLMLKKRAKKTQRTAKLPQAKKGDQLED